MEKNEEKERERMCRKRQKREDATESLVPFGVRSPNMVCYRTIINYYFSYYYLKKKQHLGTIS
jgi:hypothetical protein